jgi:hypothetical protein
MVKNKNHQNVSHGKKIEDGCIKPDQTISWFQANNIE